KRGSSAGDLREPLLVETKTQRRLKVLLAVLKLQIKMRMRERLEALAVVVALSNRRGRPPPHQRAQILRLKVQHRARTHRTRKLHLLGQRRRLLRIRRDRQRRDYQQNNKPDFSLAHNLNSTLTRIKPTSWNDVPRSSLTAHWRSRV